MSSTRAILSLVAILLVAGGIVMQFLVILSGLGSSPLNQVFFLEADPTGVTSSDANFHNPARWTYLAICGVMDGLNANCGPKGAAIPFDPARNFGVTMGLPQTFIDHGGYYYYLSRVSWAFYLVAAFFAVCTFFMSIAAIFARLGAYLTGLFAFLAFVFQALCSSLMVAWTVQARNAFQSNGQSASLGVKAYGFSWGSMAAFLIAMILFCAGGSAGKDKSSGKKSYFGRKRSTRSRGSFIDTTNDSRIKDDSSFDRA